MQHFKNKLLQYVLQNWKSIVISTASEFWIR